MPQIYLFLPILLTISFPFLPSSKSSVMNTCTNRSIFGSIPRSGITRSNGDVFEYSGADNFIKEFLDP